MPFYSQHFSLQLSSLYQKLKKSGAEIFALLQKKFYIWRGHFSCFMPIFFFALLRVNINKMFIISDFTKHRNIYQIIYWITYEIYHIDRDTHWNFFKRCKIENKILFKTVKIIIKAVIWIQKHSLQNLLKKN